MSDFQTQSLFGNSPNTSQLLPGEWNPAGQDSTDIGAILADGIRGTVDKMMRVAVGEKYASGQLTSNVSQRPDAGLAGLLPLVLVVGVVYALAKS